MKRKNYLSLLLLSALAVLSSCSGNRTNAVDLQRKIDSVLAVENKEQLRLQGINLDDVSPLQEFYDSLNIQPLPLQATEDYAALLPNFTEVPSPFAPLFQQNISSDLRAVSLPETLGTRLILLAVADKVGKYSIWLYSLDVDYLVADRLLLYTPTPDGIGGDVSFSQFVIDNDYVVTLQQYNSADGSIAQQSYEIDMSRHFQKKEH